MKKQLKPVTSTDVECLLSPIVGGAKKLTSLVDIIKEKNKPNALIRPKRFIPHTIFLLIHHKVKSWGGRYRAKQRLWEVPLDE